MNYFFTCSKEQNIQDISFDEIRISCYELHFRNLNFHFKVKGETRPPHGIQRLG